MPTLALGHIRMAGAPASSFPQSQQPPSPADALSEEEFGRLMDDDVTMTCTSIAHGRKPVKEQ